MKSENKMIDAALSQMSQNNTKHGDTARNIQKLFSFFSAHISFYLSENKYMPPYLINSKYFN